MKINEILETNFIDNKDGWGAVPDNQEIDYKGLRVLMRPSVFLSLATKLHNIESADRIKSHLKSGGKIGAPFLIVDIIDDDIPQIIGHDGRNRMIAIMRLQGDSPIEVHIFPIGMRRKHMSVEIIQHLNSGAKKEKSSRVIDGPLFKKYKMQITENSTVKLNDIYDDEIDEDELLFHYIDDDMMNYPYTVREIIPKDAKNLLTAIGDMTILDAFKHYADKEQKNMIKDKIKHFDDNRIIVLHGKKVLDGNHHLIAAIKLNKKIRFIDLSENE
jgi:hypothetical protein